MNHGLSQIKNVKIKMQNDNAKSKIKKCKNNFNIFNCHFAF